MRQKISKRRGISGIGLLMSAMQDWCKNTAAKYWHHTKGSLWLIRRGRRNDPFERVQQVNVEQPLRIDFDGECLELKKFVKMLTIGDRIRVLCDDGVVVAEKVSQTEFRLIDSQRMSKLVH